MPGDASFRRYFRVRSGMQSYVLMDASQQMDCFESFIAIAKTLSTLGVLVPTILAYEALQGYMLISDFGDRLYLQELKADNADELYKTALSTLSVFQACRQVPGWALPAFDTAFMQRELAEFNTWFLVRYLKLDPTQEQNELLARTFSFLSERASEQ